MAKKITGGGDPPNPPVLPVADQGNGGLCDGTTDPVCFWNDKFLKAAFTDSNKKQNDQEQGGPIRVTRAGAILHAAIHDAVNGVVPVYEPYLVRERAPASSPGSDKTPPTPEAAVGTAALVVLSWLYPSQAVLFTGAFLEYFGGTMPVAVRPRPCLRRGGRRVVHPGAHQRRQRAVGCRQPPARRTPATRRRHPTRRAKRPGNGAPTRST